MAPQPQEIPRLTPETTDLETHSAEAEQVYAFPNAADQVVLEVFAGSGANTVTVISQAEVTEGLAKANKVVSLSARGKARILLGRKFATEAGRITVRHSAPSGVKVSAFYLV